MKLSNKKKNIFMISKTFGKIMSQNRIVLVCVCSVSFGLKLMQYFRKSILINMVDKCIYTYIVGKEETESGHVTTM